MEASRETFEPSAITHKVIQNILFKILVCYNKTLSLEYLQEIKKR